MKKVIIGDIHGRSVWKLIVHLEKPDQVIFMADYFDSYDITALEQLYNFKQIIDYKKSNPNTILLLGNHDMGYWPGIKGWLVEGYQAKVSPNITQLLWDNKEYLQMAYQDENDILYTHAGVSKVWLQDNNWDGQQNIVDFVNDLLFYKPLCFDFSSMDLSGEGSSKHQGPTWIRPISLLKSWKGDKTKPKQIVGHTPVNRIDIEGSNKWTGGKLFMVDALGTSGEYLIIKDGILSVGKIKGPCGHFH